MKWTGRRQSSNVEDRRRMPIGNKTMLGGGAMGIIIAVVMYFLKGGDASQIGNELKNLGTGSNQTSSQPIDPEEDEMAKYISVALADNEEIWQQIFAQNNLEYVEPKLVLFRGETESGCGYASSATGPFYCPADQKVYIDLSFFDELRSKFGAEGGDFAVSYVLAHEIGHHVQNLLGTSGRVHELEQSLSKEEGNKYSVALELQADFYAGVWAYHNQKLNNVLEEGDIEEALSAASAVGDDRIQKRAQGYVVPESFTHGSSAQRMQWFKKGFETGNIKAGNTFASMGLQL